MQKVKKGFTLVELSLSMVFVSLLSLIMLTIIMNSISAYRRGLTLDLVNTTGSDLVDEFRTTIQSSPAISLTEECAALYSTEGTLKKCREDLGRSFVKVARYGKAVSKDESETIDNIPIYGAICTGKYTYVWNSGYFMSEDYDVYVGAEKREKGMIVKYKVEGSTDAMETDGLEKLLKISDGERMVCKAVAGYRPGALINEEYAEGIYRNYEGEITEGTGDGDITGTNIDSVVDITMGGITISAEPIDFLESDSFTNLALYDFTTGVPAKAIGVNSMFYSMSFILGTLQGGANVKAAGGNCKTPVDGGAAFEYCAINKFNFAAQANGG